MKTEELEAEFNRLGCNGEFGDRLYAIEAELRNRFMVTEIAADVLAE